MRAFVSYNSRDLRRVGPIVERIGALQPSWDIYFAPTRNVAGAYWIEELGRELAGCDAVMLFLGTSVGAWQEIEFYDAFRRFTHDRRPRILPVLLDDMAPGLPFLNHLHRLKARDLDDARIADDLLSSLQSDLPRDSNPMWRETNPYSGLHSRSSSSSAYFFGREAKTAELLDELRRDTGKVLTLVGNSGVGKSSVISAGVIGALRSQIWPEGDAPWPDDLESSRAWMPLTLKPGETPVKALALAFARTWLDDPADREAQALKWAENFRNGSTLADLVAASREAIAEATRSAAPERFLLNIDQSEELYTRAAGAEAARFSELVSEAAGVSGLSIVASLRSDFYGALQNDRTLFPVTTRIDVPPLGREAIEDVIGKPAALLGAEFDIPEIVPVLAEAASRAPGGLPLLSYMLEEAWEKMRQDDASDGRLRFLAGAIDIARPLVERAEKFLRQNPAHEEALKRLLTLRLAHVPKEGEPVRRRAMRSDCSEEEWALAAELAGPDLRLLTTGESDSGEPIVEVAHEALLRSWPRLSGWLEAERGFLIWKGSLEAARQDREAAPPERRQDALLMGLPLETAGQWRGTRGGDLSDADRGFIDASLDAEAARKRQKEAKEAELEDARLRLERRRKLLLKVFAAAFVIAAVLGATAFLNWQDARTASQQLAGALQAEEGARRTAEAATEAAELAADRLAQEVNRADAALADAEAELRRRQTGWSRLAARMAWEQLGDGQADRALAIAVSAFPDESRSSWGELNTASRAAPVLSEAMAGARMDLTLRGHEDWVQSAAFSPDGGRIVTASDDRTARVWDAESGAGITALRGHAGSVRSAAFSPDGGRIVTASDDRTARVWDAESGAEITLLSGHEDWVLSAAFSPDGGRVVTASDDRTARVWNAQSGAEITLLRGHEEWVRSAAFSPDGGRIVTGSSDDTARVWDAETGAEITLLRGHAGSVQSAAFSPDGGRIVTASDDRTARVWDAESGAEITALRGHASSVQSAAFSPDGGRIVTASVDRTARVWNAESGAEITVLRGHEDWVRSAAFSPDGGRIVTASDDRTARVWDAESGAEITALRGHAGSVQSAAFSPDGGRVVTGSSDDTARVWDAESGAEITVLRGHEDWVRSAAFSPDGGRIVTGSSDDTARVWDAETGAESTLLRGHAGSVRSAAFSPDGGRIVTASDDRTARVWDAESGAEITLLSGHEDWVQSAAFSPDGGRIVTASDDDTARVWDAESGAEITLLRGHEDWVRSAAFSPDGGRIVTASDDTARVWDAESGAEITVLRGHASSVRSAAFSPDGGRIVTASDDRTARVWDAESGAEIKVLRGHEDWVQSAAFSPDGGRIVTASLDGTARVWDAPPLLEELVDQARARVLLSDALSHDQKCEFYLETGNCP